MSNNSPLVSIDLTPEYKKDLRDLSKRYHNIRLDTQETLEQISGANTSWELHW
ncbi:hypothetical protein [Calothrix sp. NIES-3974]|uniref:hypothetical protein n=1 Tax=Calothrix sp. NIES-3974 TaxID=2005462 RepID=UPI000B613682|nr:hypothetical protein [Calothrix sp. NIES-3974]BAZ05324.1 hypothetical protein NIES3974_19710 [Calothrix sp. NIES-3974]